MRHWGLVTLVLGLLLWPILIPVYLLGMLIGGK